jgi:hypothetical protein
MREFSNRELLAELFRQEAFNHEIENHQGLTDELIKLCGNLQRKRILVMHNPDILLALRDDRKIPNRWLTLYGAGDPWMPSLAEQLGVKYIHDINIPVSMDVPTTFDVVISNPPYSLSGDMTSWNRELRGLWKSNRGAQEQTHQGLINRMTEGTKWAMIAPTKAAKPTSRVSESLPIMGWSTMRTDLKGFFEIQVKKDHHLSMFTGTMSVNNPEIVKVDTNGHIQPFEYGFYPTLDEMVDTDIVNKYIALTDKLVITRQPTSSDFLYVPILVQRYSPNTCKNAPKTVTMSNTMPLKGTIGYINPDNYGGVDALRLRTTQWGISRFVWHHILDNAPSINPKLIESMPDLTKFENEMEVMKAIDIDDFQINRVKVWADKN